MVVNIIYFCKRPLAVLNIVDTKKNAKTFLVLVVFRKTQYELVEQQGTWMKNMSENKEGIIAVCYYFGGFGSTKENATQNVLDLKGN